MQEAQSPPIVQRPGVQPAAAGDNRVQALRRLGGSAHQLRAATRAADHFIALGVEEDRNTGSWLMSCAVGLAQDVASDIDGIARSLKDAPTDATFAQAVQALRVRAHQLHAATRAADHFLDQDSREDRDTGSWLIACARGLADKLAAEIDDGASSLKRPAAEATADDHDAALVRRVVQATAVARA